VSLWSLPRGGCPIASVPAHTVSVYVAHGSSVDAGVKDSESPVAFHVPATAGVSIGAGESGAGGADRRTTSRAVPSTIASDGKPVTRVGTAGFAGVVGELGVGGAVGAVWPAGAVVGAPCVGVPVAGVVVLASAAPGVAIAARAHVNAKSRLVVTDVKGSLAGESAGGRQSSRPLPVAPGV
jgi:hypothetical protein